MSMLKKMFFLAATTLALFVGGATLVTPLLQDTDSAASSSMSTRPETCPQRCLRRCCGGIAGDRLAATGCATTCCQSIVASVCGSSIPARRPSNPLLPRQGTLLPPKAPGPSKAPVAKAPSEVPLLLSQGVRPASAPLPLEAQEACLWDVGIQEPLLNSRPKRDDIIRWLYLDFPEINPSRAKAREWLFLNHVWTASTSADEPPENPGLVAVRDKNLLRCACQKEDRVDDHMHQCGLSDSSAKIDTTNFGLAGRKKFAVLSTKADLVQFWESEIAGTVDEKLFVIGGAKDHHFFELRVGGRRAEPGSPLGNNPARSDRGDDDGDHPYATVIQSFVGLFSASAWVGARRLQPESLCPNRHSLNADSWYLTGWLAEDVCAEGSFWIQKVVQALHGAPNNTTTKKAKAFCHLALKAVRQAMDVVDVHDTLSSTSTSKNPETDLVDAHARAGGLKQLSAARSSDLHKLFTEELPEILYGERFFSKPVSKRAKQLGNLVFGPFLLSEDSWRDDAKSILDRLHDIENDLQNPTHADWDYVRAVFSSYHASRLQRGILGVRLYNPFTLLENPATPKTFTVEWWERTPTAPPAAAPSPSARSSQSFDMTEPEDVKTIIKEMNARFLADKNTFVQPGATVHPLFSLFWYEAQEQKSVLDRWKREMTEGSFFGSAFESILDAGSDGGIPYVHPKKKLILTPHVLYRKDGLHKGGNPDLRTRVRVTPGVYSSSNLFIPTGEAAWTGTMKKLGNRTKYFQADPVWGKKLVEVSRDRSWSTSSPHEADPSSAVFEVVDDVILRDAQTQETVQIINLDVLEWRREFVRDSLIEVCSDHDEVCGQCVWGRGQFCEFLCEFLIFFF